MNYVVVLIGPSFSAFQATTLSNYHVSCILPVVRAGDLSDRFPQGHGHLLGNTQGHPRIAHPIGSYGFKAHSSLASAATAFGVFKPISGSVLHEIHTTQYGLPWHMALPLRDLMPFQHTTQVNRLQGTISRRQSVKPSHEFLLYRFIHAIRIEAKQHHTGPSRTYGTLTAIISQLVGSWEYLNDQVLDPINPHRRTAWKFQSLSLTYRWWLLKDRVFCITASPTSSDSEMLLAKALSIKHANVKAI